ncbi:MAG TPA: hypothetical protein VNM92_03550 [Thermoanaerobaculia bacterium]|nr:hypothetical protein [Thermoanaerobaculia bacterium]
MPEFEREGKSAHPPHSVGTVQVSAGGLMGTARRELQGAQSGLCDLRHQRATPVMRSRAIAITILVFLCTVYQAGAQQEAPPGFVRVLLPIDIRETAGRFGSLWKSELAIYNSGPDFVQFRPVACPFECTFGLLDPGTSVNPSRLQGFGQFHGSLLFVRVEHAAQLHYSLRVLELSRRALPYGTELPVVRESDFRTSAAYLVNVPIDGTSRQTVRIYHPNPRALPGIEFDVRFYQSPGRDLIAKRRLAIITAPDPGLIGAQVLFFNVSGIAQLDDLYVNVPELRAFSRVTIEVAPVTPGTKFWTYFQAIDNDTQALSVVTPQSDPKK